MSNKNLITIIPGPPSEDGYCSTRGTKVFAGDDVEIHGIRRIDLVAEVNDVWQVRLEAFGGELPLLLAAQLADERMLVSDYSYPLILWEGRLYTAEELADYAAAHAAACMQAHRDRLTARPLAVWEKAFEIGAALAIGAMLATIAWWVVAS